MELVYITGKSIDDCMKAIACAPWTYQCKWGTEMWYECNKLSDAQMLVTFKGGQFRRARRTQYLLTFTANAETTVTLKFHREMFGLCVPMTPTEDIDCFMKEKIGAVRQPN